MKLLIIFLVLSFSALSNPDDPPTPTLDFGLFADTPTIFSTESKEVCTPDSYDNKEKMLGSVEEDCKNGGSLDSIIEGYTRIYSSFCGETVANIVKEKFGSMDCEELARKIDPILEKGKEAIDDRDRKTEIDNASLEKVENICKKDENSILRCYSQANEKKDIYFNSLLKVAFIPFFSDHNTELPKSESCDCIAKKIDNLGVAYPSDSKKKNMVKIINNQLKKEMLNDMNNELELLIQDFSAHNQNIPQKCEKPFHLLKKNINRKLNAPDFATYLDRHSNSPEPVCGAGKRVARSHYFQVSEDQMKSDTDLRSVDSAIVSLVKSIDELPTNARKCLHVVGLDPDRVSVADILILAERSIPSIFPRFSLDKKRAKCLSTLDGDEVKEFKGRIIDLGQEKILDKFSKSVGKLPFLRQALMTPVSKLSKIIKRSSRNTDEGLMLFEKLEKNPKGLSKSLSEIASKRCDMIADKIEEIQKTESIITLREPGRGVIISDSELYPKPVINEMINKFYQNRIKSRDRDFTKHVDLFTLLAEDYCLEAQGTILVGIEGNKIPKTKLDLPVLLSDESIIALNDNEKKNISIPILDHANKLCEDSNHKTEFEKLVKDKGARDCFIFGATCDSPAYQKNARILSEAISEPGKEYEESSLNQAIRSIASAGSSAPVYGPNAVGNITSNNTRNLSSTPSSSGKVSTEDERYQRLIDEIADLKRNQNKLNQTREDYRNKIFSDKKLSPSEINDFEQRLAELEQENSKLKNKIKTTSNGNRTDNEKSTEANGKSFETKLKRNNLADFKAAEKLLSEQVAKNMKGNSINGSNNAGARVLGQLSSRQIASIASRISGNNPVDRDDSLVINVDSIENLGTDNMNQLIDTLSKQQVSDLQNAILKQQSIVIRASNSNRNITIAPESAEYALIAQRYSRQINKKVDEVSSQGPAARAIASEASLFYRSLLENSKSILSN